jgi:Dual specificity phosphatase, catalytic domain
VINLCEEYRGPDRSYQRLGMQHLHLPTTDHFEPSLKDIFKAMRFIQQHEQRNEKVYVHCRAGHGRSAAIAYAWLLTKNPNVDLQQLNEELCSVRNVRKTLYQQPNLLKFHSMLLQRQNGNSDADDELDADDDIADDDDDDDGSNHNTMDDDDNDEDDRPLYSFKNIEDEL